MKHANLDFNLGSVNPSGIGQTVYRIRKRYITSWPTIKNDPDESENIGPDDLGKYVGDFTLATGKKWEEIYSTQGKGSINAESTGETDCKMFVNHGTFSYPDLPALALGFAKASVNDDYVYIVKSAGRFHVIGSPDYRTVTNVGGSGSGDSAGSAKGLEFTVECPDVTPLPVYEGVIALEGGTLDTSTGTFTASTSS